MGRGSFALLDNITICDRLFGVSKQSWLIASYVELEAESNVVAVGEKKLWWLAVILICLVLIVTASLLVSRFQAGIRVTITNAGTTPLKSVVLHVTGSSHSLGDIEPSSSKRAVVKPTSESHLEIEFVDAEGKVHRLDAGGYFEPGYRGKIRVSIKDGEIEKNEQDI